MQRMILRAIAAMALIAVVVAAGGYHYVRRSLPQIDGTVTVTGLSAPVEIVRDADAIPHIFAATKIDGLFGLGYVHAQDRLWQMEFQRRIGHGRLSEILAFITNLEHAGDIAERGVAANLAKQVKRNLAFSPQGSGEIREMLQRLVKNVRAAAAVFMTDDVRAARGLLGEKEVFRDLETRATEAHFARVRAGRVESVETSAQHLDMLRDLKRINAHVAAAAYPVLEKRGELLSSRLRQDS